MSSIFEKWNPMVVLMVVATTGCKLGVPIDRNVQISRHFGDEDHLDTPPQTRLSHSAAIKPSIAGVATNAFPGAKANDSDPVIESLSDRGGDDLARRAVAKKPSETMQSAAEVDLRSPAAQLMQAAELDDEELADLLAAFRDSPPEVQQQAIRQLIAAASVRAKSSQHPIDITQQLKLSLQDLPTLPDDVEDSATLPTRLAATGDAIADVAVPGIAAAHSRDKPGQTAATVAQAVVAAADGDNAVAKASSVSSSTGLAGAPNAPATNEPKGEMVMPRTVGDPAGDVNRDKNELYKQLIAALAVPEAGESDGDRFRRDLARRYLLVLSGDPDSAVLAMQGLTKPEEEFLRHDLLAVWKLIDPDGHPVANRRFAAALIAHRGAARYLSEATEQLEVQSLAFCTEIVSYGQVKRFASTRFAPGQKVILYCEIDNFVAEKTADGYHTELQGSYEIFDDRGAKVAGQVLPTDRQRCDQYLRDYFIAYQMHLPAQLEPGKYRLELTMECAKGKKYGQGSLPLEIK
jgi:hypothetical protein